MAKKYILIALFIIFLIVGIYSAQNILFKEPENNNWTVTGSIVANNSSYVLTDSNKPIITNDYYPVVTTTGEYLGEYPATYNEKDGPEYYNYTLKFSVNLSDIDWKVEIEDPKNTEFNEEIIKQNLTNELIKAHEKGSLIYDGKGHVTIKEGILAYTENSSENQSSDVTDDITIHFDADVGNFTIGEHQKIEFNVTIPKENFNI
ncbi:hypothetical protein [Methanosphaera sp. BMS]|uniref:hypothetical protein n=1 Tax=Methanosphaera sp. BMS TaxID=1789762 RepID=UPI000DC1CC1D|nr:hypothetical protein [Methanosphaera sp. BMS]AWX31713.1 hypothetical protein AW729_00805 [Methanosphaera sp. BMS]